MKGAGDVPVPATGVLAKAGRARIHRRFTGRAAPPRRLRIFFAAAADPRGHVARRAATRRKRHTMALRRFPLLAKSIALVGVLIALMLALQTVSGIVAEREGRLREAERSVAASLASAQTLVGPVIERECSESSKDAQSGPALPPSSCPAAHRIPLKPGAVYWCDAIRFRSFALQLRFGIRRYTSQEANEWT